MYCYKFQVLSIITYLVLIYYFRCQVFSITTYLVLILTVVYLHSGIKEIIIMVFKVTNVYNILF